MAVSGAHPHFGVCQDCAYLGGETHCDSTRASRSALECLLFGVPIEPDDAGLLCAHFQPKSERREGLTSRMSSANCDLGEGCLIDLRRQRELHSLGKTADCVEVPPVDCFYEGENMVVINLDECVSTPQCLRAGMSRGRAYPRY